MSRSSVTDCPAAAEAMTLARRTSKAPDGAAFLIDADCHPQTIAVIRTRAIPLGNWNWKALRVVNAHFREVATIMRGMRTGMRLLTSGRLEIGDLVTHRFGLDEVGDAFQIAVDKPAGFLKSTVILERE